jgi:hypothetical protein
MNNKPEGDEIIPPRPAFRLISKDYVSFIGSGDSFKKMIYESAVRNGYGKFKETVVISDGSYWAGDLISELFNDAQQILDFYCLCQKVSNFGMAYFKIPGKKIKNNDNGDNLSEMEESSNYDNYKNWTQKICEKIRKSRYREVLDDIIKKESWGNNALNRKLSGYLISNMHMIDYDAYESKGYDIGCCELENATKNQIKKRLVGPGMRWYLENAQSIVTLKLKLESNKWEEDVVQPIKRLYGIIPSDGS